MNRFRRGAALLLVLALTGSLRAQSGTKDAVQQFNDIIAQQRDDELKQTTQIAQEVNALLGNMRKFLLLGEAQQLAMDSKFVEAAKDLEQSVGDFERNPASRLPPANALRYRDALLELGRVRAVMGEADHAAERVGQALQVERERARATAPGSVEDEMDRVTTLLKAANVYAAAEKPEIANHCLDEALERCTRTSGPLRGPGRDLLLAHCRLLKGALTCADQSTDSYEIAVPLLQQALDAFLQQYPPQSYKDGTPEIGSAHAALAAALANLGQGPRAMVECQQARRCLAKQFPNGSPDLAGVYEVLAQLHFEDRQEPAALDDVRQARKELDRCFPPGQYPDGHPLMVQAETALAAALDRIGHPDLALSFDEEALDHCQKLYPDGRDDWVAALLNYGQTLQDGRRLEDARRPLERARDMARRLHSADDRVGRPLIARCLLRLGALQGLIGETKEARETLRQAADLYRTLADGGPSLSAVACELGKLALRDGDRAAAGRAFAEALEADRGQLRNLTRAAAEVEVLTFTEHRRLALAGYLSATRGAKESDAQAFAAVWASQGAVTRLAEARRLALRQARDASPAVRQELEDLRDCCVRLRLAARGGRKPEDNEDLQERRNRLEARLSALWPEPPFDDGRRGADALAAALPGGSAFIDFVLYDDAADGSCYTAFVVAAGGKPKRIDLGPAGPIKMDIDAWRQAVAAWDPNSSVRDAWEAASDNFAGQLRGLVWDRLAPLLEGTGTVYLALDGDLTRFPFAALPGRTPGSILLEERTLAAVPNGPFLLDHLSPAGAAAGPPVDFLAVGEVEYDAPGGRQESLGNKVNAYVTILLQNQPLAAVSCSSYSLTLPQGQWFPVLPDSGEGLALAERVVAPGHALTLRKEQATLAAVCRELARARQAHLSTHGYFEYQLWDREAGQLDAYLRHWSPDVEAPPAVLGPDKRYPLSYVGLALTGANGKADAENPGVLTGEEIADLRLDGLALVTLGACDTGLGEYTAGEGVETIQRAFHLAGCPNVVATLWDVDDRATVVLMQEFYHQLWDNHLPSLEALRQAQLTIYHHPDLLTALGAPRGALTEVDPGAEPALPPPAVSGPRSHAYVQSWAAFVHSGVGERVAVPLRAPVSSVSLMSDAPAGGGSFPWPWVGAAAAVLVLGAAGAVWRRRARRDSRSVPAAPALAEDAVPLMATLVDDPALAEDPPTRDAPTG